MSECCEVTERAAEREMKILEDELTRLRAENERLREDLSREFLHQEEMLDKKNDKIRELRNAGVALQKRVDEGRF